MPLVQVEPGTSSILRGLAVPFEQHAFLVDPKSGDLYAEVFDPESIPRPPQNVPLLISHNRDRPPAGKVLSSVIMPQGLGIEAKLVGDDHELEGWRRRFENELMVGLSIGFRTGTKPVWEPPPSKGSPPIRRVRGAEIVEVSIVNYPAYENAATLSLNQRSYYEEELHRQSEETIAWVAARKDKKHRELEEIFAWVAARKAAATRSMGSKPLKG